jgi:DNA-binding GntR family transcriptional regulator
MPGAEDKIPKNVLGEIFPRKLEQYRVAENMYLQLKRMILSGKLKKGVRIFREDVAQSFEVSEAEVSKAFQRLKKDGLVVVRPGLGTYVVW